MSRIILMLSGLLGAAGILIGAFGAHALPNVLKDLPPEELLIREEWLATGVAYHMYHALALLAVGLYGATTTNNNSKHSFLGSAVAWLIGIMVFSGCLYAMTLTGIKFLGAFVPIGGVAFVVGWALVLVNGLQKHSPPA